MDQLIQSKIDERMQLGYQALATSERSGASGPWHQVWKIIAGLMRDGSYRSIEELDNDFRGRQSVANWANDYVQEILRVDKGRTANWADLVDFCQQYLAWSGKPESLNNRNRRRLIGEGLFALGRPEDGDAAFSAFLAENPRWGWGWISWAGQYSRQVPWHDLAKAESILRQGLKVDGLDNRQLVVEQLRIVLRRQGRPIEASLLL